MTCHARHGRSTVPMAVAAVTAMAMGVAGTVMWLTASNTVGNAFDTADTTVSVVEDFTAGDTVKRNVHVGNDGDVPVYVRARIDMSWTEDGETAWGAPSCDDSDGCVIDYGDAATDGSWVRGGDGYWYWTAPVPSDAATGNLIDSLTLTDTGRTLVCDISAQSIQADPTRAVEDAWGATVDESTLTLTPAM